MSYSITVTFDTLGEAAAWFKSQGQNVNAVPTNAPPASTGAPSNTQTSESDPWTDDAPTRPANGSQSNGEPREEFCSHGKMRYISSGQYGPFYGCPLDRNHPDKCKTRKA